MLYNCFKRIKAEWVISLRKLFLAFMVCSVCIMCRLSAFAADNLGLTGEEFLTRLANVSFRVPYGFSSTQVMGAEHSDDSIILSRNNSVFLTIQETPPPREVKNISAVLITQSEEGGKELSKSAGPGDNIVFESVCTQIMYALHPSLKDEDAGRLMKGLGMRGEVLDGTQRSFRYGSLKYITKYSKNGMLIMVVSSL